ncbi:MAG: hypothetical protein IJY41_05120 [Clostridia bacterium]|nr:hypothetical protein [Clostridia bacterium]
MITRIINILKSDKGVSDYRINILKRESYELFFVHKDLETVRSTDTTDIKVTVFVENGDKLGDATFSVYSSYTDEMIAKEIESAKKKAALAGNKPYALPENETGIWESKSNFKGYSAPELAAMVADAAFKADSYEGGSINALEIFIYKDTVTVKNSRNIDKTETQYSAMVEAIPTWNGEKESVELYECYNFTEFDASAVTAEIDGKMREVRDRLVAIKPESKLNCRVVLTASELGHLFGNLASNLNYSSVYNHVNAFSKGDDVQKSPVGDKLTVTMKGRMTGSVSSCAFDASGVTTRDAEVIKDGKAVGYYGPVRFASYLGEEPTGNIRCIKAECGTLTDKELSSAPYFKCVSMSGLQLDIYNDYIGGEVRLAYYFDGEKEIPVTGISISGKLSDALSNMRLSNEETTYESYKGPKYAVFENIEIV